MAIFTTYSNFILLEDTEGDMDTGFYTLQSCKVLHGVLYPQVH